ncbi:MAG: HPr family phosphocarrier protein [Planctomycetota bacterium]|jgi:phosphocarrier protein
MDGQECDGEGQLTGAASRRRFVVVAPEGLATLESAALVKVAERFSATIRISHGGMEADGKSIMRVMILAVYPGEVIEVRAEGEDAAEALTAIGQLESLAPEP